MAEPYVGQIVAVGFNFAPRGWALCHGQLLPISNYDALFALIGTTYGGDGQQTFAVPDLRGRAAVHQGTGQGLTNRVMGEKSGTETAMLLTQQIPPHGHSIAASTSAGTQAGPAGGVLAAASLRGANDYAATANVTLALGSLQAVGGSQPHANMQPSATVNFIIALEGIFPPRN